MLNLIFHSKRRWLHALATGAGLLMGVPYCGAQNAPLPPSGPALPSSTDPVVMITGTRSNVEIVERLAKSLELNERIVRVDGFDPGVIDVKAVTPSRIRIQAVAQGVTNLALTNEAGKVYQVDVFIKGDVRHLQAVLDNRFPDSAIEAYKVGEAVALTGWVSQPEHITQITEIAEQFYPKVLNQMQVGGVQQVKLHVRIMEVQRSKLRKLGFDFIANGTNGFFSSRPGNLVNLNSLSMSPGSIPSLGIAPSTAANAPVAFGLVGANEVFTAFIDALRQESLLKTLADPILVTTNGRPATMLSGGEFPILVPQGLGTISVSWRQFGVRMEAVPIILGDGRVRLEVMPEVTDRDFANATTLSGTTIPALTTRRINTQVEMRFGQTLMLAGLVSTRQTTDTSKLPFFGELPWIGTMFRRVQDKEVETELVIVLTPELVAPMEKYQVPAGGPGLFTTSPTDSELFFDGYLEVPNYGDPCKWCNGIGNCEQCQTGTRAAPKAFTVPIQEETILEMPPSPASEKPSERSAAPVFSEPERASEKASPPLDDKSAALRQLNRPPRGTTTPADGGLRQVGFKSRTAGQQPVSQATFIGPGAADRSNPSARGSTAGSATGTAPAPSTKPTRRGPGLIEP